MTKRASSVGPRTKGRSAVFPESAYSAAARWISRGVWATADQGLFSASNFVITVLLARWLPPTDFGAFTLAYSCFLFVGTVHTALLTEPLLVFAGGRFAGNFADYLRTVIRGHWSLSLSGAAVLLVASGVAWALGSEAVALSLLGTAAATPFILFAWLLRRACFTQLRPGLAASAGALSLIFSIGAAVVLYGYRVLTVLTAPLAMGIASGLAAVYLVIALRHHTRLTEEATLKSPAVRLEHWRYGRWALGASALSWSQSSIFYFILPVTAGLASVATLRALMNLVMPAIQAFGAMNALCIPAFAYARDRLWRRMPIIVSGYAFAALGYSALLCLFSDRLLLALYGAAYNHASGLVWVFGLLPLFTGLCGLLGSALRALERPDYLLGSAMVGVLVAIGPGLLLSRAYGVGGAGWGLLLAYAASSAASFILLKRQAHSRGIEKESPAAFRATQASQGHAIEAWNG